MTGTSLRSEACEVNGGRGSSDALMEERAGRKRVRQVASKLDFASAVASNPNQRDINAGVGPVACRGRGANQVVRRLVVRDALNRAGLRGPYLVRVVAICGREAGFVVPGGKM